MKKRIFKNTINKYFKDISSLQRLIEEEDRNIIELNLKYNERNQTKSFGIKNFIKKLYSIFEDNYINLENKTMIEPNDLYNYFFLNDLRSIDDIFIKIKGKMGFILNSFLLFATLIIPFLDNAVVLSLDISLIINISNLFGYNLTKNRAKEILKFILFGKKGNLDIMRLIGLSIRIFDLVGDGVKFVPIVGTVAGGVISNAVNVGEVYFVFKQTINYYLEIIKEK